MSTEPRPVLEGIPNRLWYDATLDFIPYIFYTK